jgi:hypothetical protein
MAEPDKRPVTSEELLVSSLAQTDAPAKLLIEKGLITQEEFMQKISEERATYQAFQSDAAMTIKASPPNGSTNTNEATEEVDEASGSFAFLRPCSW